MLYTLMRKNTSIGLMEFSDDGVLVKYMIDKTQKKLLPLRANFYPSGLQQWWKERSIPIGQGRIEEMLKRQNIINPEEFLVKNLGLSLTDYYWICPVDSDLKWEDVNMYDNPFTENLLEYSQERASDNTPQYTPNSTLQGQLEKTWSIDTDGTRILIKGNRDNYSAESINETIASELHHLQEYDNYTPYSLLKIKDKNYDYGCFSKLFTSQQFELVSAYAVVMSEKQPNDLSSYEQFINICKKHGADANQLRADLEYQIMTDFILSGRDRHLNNIGVLRDADTLKFVRAAPIFDSGKCLFVNDYIPTTEKEMLNININSFAKNARKMLSYITTPSLVDVTKLPSPEFIKKQYSLDTQMEPNRINMIAEAYEKKIDMFRNFQLGKDLNPYVASINPKNKIIKNNDDRGIVFDVAKHDDIRIVKCNQITQDIIKQYTTVDKDLLIIAENSNAYYNGEKEICDSLLNDYKGEIKFTEGKWEWDTTDITKTDELIDFVLTQEKTISR